MSLPHPVMLFAAGFGTRMKPLTDSRPKPLIKVAGKPLLDHALDLVRAEGAPRTVVNSHYLGAQIAAHLDGQDIATSYEDTILDTGGGLRHALPLLGDQTVFTMNTDAVWAGPNPLRMLADHWNPDQMEACREDALWTAAFEEGVRWVAPIQVSARLVTDDTQIRGYDIPRGETVMTIQASANHDEDLYEHPERFDMFRPKRPHQAFGNGPHFCQGTHIARRMLADIMLPMLFDRFPNMRLPDPSKVQFYGFGFRGPLQLPVILG